MLSLDGFNFLTNKNIKGKTIVLRTDLNSTVSNGQLVKGPKLIVHGNEIAQMVSKGAKIVVLSHQGREGDDDFISLEQHGKMLESIIGKKIIFCKWSDPYEQRIRRLKDGQILLMENTRFLKYECEELSPEEQSKHAEIQKIAKNADLYVLGALSISHRSHASVVGFIPLLPSFVGYSLEKELRALKELKSDNNVLLLGGMKPEDSLKVIRNSLEEDRVSKILLGGILGELALKAEGISLGSKDTFIQEKNFLPFVEQFEEILSKYRHKIILPKDLAIETTGTRRNIEIKDLPTNSMIYDIGEKTIQEYCKILSNAGTVVFNGPLGMFEDERFRDGTMKVVQCIADSNAFSIIGGGDTLTCLQQIGFREEQFSHVSLAGKALLRFLSGKRLIALTALYNY